MRHFKRKRVSFVSLVRLLLELTRIHLFPVGSEFTFWPFAWGFLPAAYHEALPMNEVMQRLLFYALLSTLIHSAACVINDMVDCDLDRKVERTKGRPIALGAITMTEASILLSFLTAAILYMGSSVDTTAFILGVAGLPAVGMYPLMKRWIYWPSLFLGLVSSWAVPCSWLATTGQFDWGIILNIAIALSCWTCIYDCIYACQDKKHDEEAGVKSTAIRLGRGIRPALSMLNVTCFVCLSWAGYLNSQCLPFYVISVIAPFLLCLWQIWSFDDNDPQDSLKTFTASRYSAVMVCTGLAVDHYSRLISMGG